MTNSWGYSAMNRHYLFLFLLGVFSWQALNAKTQSALVMRAGVDGVYDENINENTTNANTLYFSPYMQLDYDEPLTRQIRLETQLRVRYENHVRERSALLNAPFEEQELALRYRQKRLIVRGGGNHSGYYAPEFQKIKNRYRIFAGLDYRFPLVTLKPEYRFEFENYGDNTQDGYTHWIEGDVDIEVFRNKKRKLVIDISPTYILENRRSNGGLYTYIKQSARGGAAIHWRSFDLYTALTWSWKVYAYNFNDAITNEPVQKENIYAQFSSSLEYTFLKSYSVKAYWGAREVESNQSGDSYSDGEIGIRLQWKHKLF